MSNSKHVTVHVTVTITADNHTHAGQPVARGTRLSVDEATAKWMAANKIAVAADAAAKKESK